MIEGLCSDRTQVQPWDQYLDLLARAVCNYLYLGGELNEAEYPNRDQLYNVHGWRIPEAARPHTGLRLAQLANLHRLAVQIFVRGIPGDFLEAGVWQGGVIIFLAGVLRSFRASNVRLWAADTFAGIPRRDPAAEPPDPVDAWTDRWAVPLEQVKANIRRYGLLDDRIQFVSGPFKEALPNSKVGQLALLRIDADAYESTRDALEELYPKLSFGGYVIIDDWHLEGCRRAVLEYRRAQKINAPVQGLYTKGQVEEDEPYEVFWIA